MSYVRVIYDPPTQADEVELDVNPGLRRVLEKPVLNWMHNSTSYKLFPKGRHFTKKETVKDIVVGERLDGSPVTRKHRLREWVEDVEKRGRPHNLYAKVLTQDEFKHLKRMHPEYIPFLKIEGSDTEKVTEDAFALQQRMAEDFAKMQEETAKEIDAARKLRDRQIAEFKEKAEKEIERAAQESGMTIREIEEYIETMKKSQKTASNQGRK